MTGGMGVYLVHICRLPEAIQLVEMYYQDKDKFTGPEALKVCSKLWHCALYYGYNLYHNLSCIPFKIGIHILSQLGNGHSWIINIQKICIKSRTIIFNIIIYVWQTVKSNTMEKITDIDIIIYYVLLFIINLINSLYTHTSISLLI